MSDWIYILKDEDDRVTVQPNMPVPPFVFRIPVVTPIVSCASEQMPQASSSSIDFGLAEANKRFKTAFYVRDN